MSKYQVIGDEDIEMVKSPSGTTTSLPSAGSVSSTSIKSNKFVMGALATFCGGIIIFLLAGLSATNNTTTVIERKSLDKLGRYTMHDFDVAKPMSNFLNGVGGLWGIPMWAFYVNRGQGIACFGQKNKDGGIMKFDTADKAYLLTPFTGFRTFVKGTKAGKEFTHMPFFTTSQSATTTRDMKIGKNDMELEEVNSELDLQTNVLYYTTVDDEFPALVRSVTFTNLDKTHDLEMEVLDGLGKLVPSGLSIFTLDTMGRTMEAWMNVYNVDQKTITEPFFHISQDPADTAQVQIIKDGHFVVSFVEGEVDEEGLNARLPFIVDPTVVYDFDTTFTHPRAFFGKKGSLDEFMSLPQRTVSATPCSFAGAKVSVPAGGSVTITSIYGHAENLETFVAKYSPKVRTPGYALKMHTEGTEVVQGVMKKVAGKTSSPLFDAYVEQDFMDNVLRGGMPIALGDSNDPKIFHTFSRIHGDLERDYNNFQIETTFFSQGPGNFRDVSQNRRLDVLHTPFVGDFNVRMFLKFVQADAYNPLTVASTNFKIPKDKMKATLKALKISKNVDILEEMLGWPFRPGQLFQDMKTKKVETSLEKEEFLNTIVAAAVQESAAKFAQNAFWSDHWTYTLDLVKNYLSIFPDQEEHMLWKSDPIPFYMSPASVKSRAKRYEKVTNKDTGVESIRVFHALAMWGDADFSPLKTAHMNTMFNDGTIISDSTGAAGVWQRAADSSVFTVSVASKLMMLGVLKFSTLDPLGMGIEMEGGKPGWNDAMNGLPGIVGSGMPETYEMMKILEYIEGAASSYPSNSFGVPVEFATFLESTLEALSKFEGTSGGAEAEFAFWDASNTARETYRAATDITFDGESTDLSAHYVSSMCKRMLAKVQASVTKAVKENGGISPSYFFYEATSFDVITPEKTDDKEIVMPDHVAVKGFKQHTLPLFLEGPVRHLKTVTDMAEKKEVYKLVKASDLYDDELDMYKISQSLKGMSPEIGRMMAFAPGWLENESIWLHMSYKYYVELLRGGLYEEFYADIKTGLVPFMDNEVYGRSPLEAASFIVSSAFPDKKLHGASFLARLSGSTAEMLSMWAEMMFGPNPFSLNNSGELELEFNPVLAADFFTKANTVECTFLGEVKVTYFNPDGLNTWEAEAKSAALYYKDGSKEEVTGGKFNSKQAKKVRGLEVASIEVMY